MLKVVLHPSPGFCRLPALCACNPFIFLEKTAHRLSKLSVRTPPTYFLDANRDDESPSPTRRTRFALLVPRAARSHLVALFANIGFRSTSGCSDFPCVSRSCLL